ncbi:MAG: hypothetical protein J3K34DRAFT_522623 [Monoraphidium minutum]|nr:MAG: hypothetical protein J3K34DRAFT_522623 [Monoraphidium minutum]
MAAAAAAGGAAREPQPGAAAYDMLSPPWAPLGRSATLGVVSGLSALLLRGLNTLRVEPSDLARFRRLALERAGGAGLLTYSNHTSTYDDPGLPSALLPWSTFWTEHDHGRNRWAMCAADVCFGSDLLRQFFQSGKVLPVERGGGAGQPALGAAAGRLAAGDWLHVFPEGRVQPAGDVGAFRQGVGKLVCDARAASGHDPIVLPVFHSGMARVMPYHSALPRAGHEVTVVVGEPLDLAPLTCRCNRPGEDQPEVWRDIAAALREALLVLEARAPPNPNQLAEQPGLALEIIASGKAGIEDLPLAAALAAGQHGGGEDGGGGGGGGGAAAALGARLQALLGAAAAEAGGGPAGALVGKRLEELSAAAAAAAAARPRGWVSALRRPHWFGDQERRQRAWAAARRGAPPAAAPALAQAHELGLQGRARAAAEGAAAHWRRRRRQWLRWHGLRWPAALLQDRRDGGGGGRGAEPQQGSAEKPARRWLWLWRRQPRASEAAAGGGGEAAAAGGPAWARAPRGAAQQCAA